ncbi:MAG: hypothetical protein ACQER7_11025 [Bacteroidota bacterium]
MKKLTISTTFLIAIAYVIPALCQAQAPKGENDQVVNIKAEDYAFQAPDEIPSGWTNIEYTNEGNEPHFVFIARLPDDRTFDEYLSDVLVPFGNVWYALRDDGMAQDKAMEKLGADLPEWYWSVEFMGGSGIIPAGYSTDLSLNFEPGTYSLECYMKTEDGEMHNMEGMMREITVTDTPSEITPPDADIDITLSNFEMAIDGDLTPGSHTVAVNVKEHPEEGFGHNVHVARIDQDTDIDNLVRWMNFLEIDGLENPGPTTFAGGMQILPEGETGYFSLDLEPGRYLFVSEYTGHLGVLQDITVE